MIATAAEQGPLLRNASFNNSVKTDLLRCFIDSRLQLALRHLA